MFNANLKSRLHLKKYLELEFTDTFFCRFRKGSPAIKKKVKKGHNVTLGGRGSPPIPFFSPNLPGPQNTWKWTMNSDTLTTTCHLSAYLQAGWLNV